MPALRDTGMSTFLHCCPKPAEAEASVRLSSCLGLLLTLDRRLTLTLTLRRLGTVETVTRAWTQRDTCLSVSLPENDERIW